MRRRDPALGRRIVLSGLALAAVFLAGPARAQEVTKAKAAAMVLDSARRAYNEGKYDLATQQFNKYIQTAGSSSAAHQARYGLALCLLEAPQQNYKAIGDLLRASVGYLPAEDRPFATYHLAAAIRGLGEEALAKARTQPNEAAKYRAQATQRFTEAAPQFAAAADAFSAQVKPLPATAPAKPPAEADWAARARCDQCDMALRTGKFAEAEPLARSVLDHKVLAKGSYRELALYQLGYACFAQKKYLEAGRALSQLAPFAQEFGVHARYLLARTHHLANERPEAMALYEAIPAAHEQRKKQAAETLRTSPKLRPERKRRLQAIVADATCDYVLRAAFHHAQLLTEAGKYAEAQAEFSALTQKNPKSPLVAEAQLRTGYCLLQTKRFPEAIKTLAALTQHPQLADQALAWTARAQVLSANPKDAAAYKAALTAAAGALRRAADLAGQQAKTDPQAKIRRGKSLLELGETQQLLGQHDASVATYKQVIDEKLDTNCVEEASQRYATALHLAGKLKESDQACRRFEERYPRSTLLPAVWFRRAENAYFVSVAAAKDANLKGDERRRKLNTLFDEAVRRYQHVIRNSPQFEYAHLARHGLATLYYHQKRYGEAIELLRKIPEFDRTGDLAMVSYLHADCLLRTLPEDAFDALGAARLVAQIDQAAKMLGSFLGARPKDPKAPDALLKLAYCHQQIAQLVTDTTERRNILQQAIAACERLQKDFATDPLAATAAFERAKCMLGVHGAGQAINELRRFAADPYRKSAVAPLALARLSSLLRGQNQAKQAADILAKYRTEFEPVLLKDPDRREGAALLQYEHALAIKALAKPDDATAPAEARKMFEALVQQFPGRPQAVNASWRASQCRRAEVEAYLQAVARARYSSAAAKELPTLRQKLQAALLALRQGTGQVHAEAINEGKRSPGSAAHLRLLYEVAWCYRLLAGGEIDAVRQQAQMRALAKARAAMGKAAPAALAPPQVPLSEIPAQPSELSARAQYEALLATAPTSPLAARVRFELAEMHLQRRGQDDSVAEAVRLLTEGVQSNPPKELGGIMRLRLASCLLAQGNPQAARSHLEAIGPKPSGYQVASQTAYLLAETFVQEENWAKAIATLLPFRDDNTHRSAPNRERALLRLAQAYAETKQWDASRQALELLVPRSRSPRWQARAYYGIGRARQELKQYDEAIKAYGEVVRRTVAEVAAKAQFGIGQCRLNLKQYPEAAKDLLLVPLTYGYPRWSAAARCEAARAYAEMKNPVEATRLYRRAIQDHPSGPWAQVAQKRLDALRSPS